MTIIMVIIAQYLRKDKTMSNLTLIIGNKNYSSWSLRPWLYMMQLGIDFEEIRISLYTPDMEAQLEPCFSDSKVPVLIDDGYSIWDSLAIMEYLADKFPENVSWPITGRARTPWRNFEFFQGVFIFSKHLAGIGFSLSSV